MSGNGSQKLGVPGREKRSLPKKKENDVSDSCTTRGRDFTRIGPELFDSGVRCRLGGGHKHVNRSTLTKM